MSTLGHAGLMLGFDAGSVALKVVLADGAGRIVERSYTRMQGRPVETALAVLAPLLERHGADAFDLVAGTGSSGRLICELLGVPFVNEVISQAAAVRKLVPQARTVIEMGGQDSKLICLADAAEETEALAGPVRDFVTNTNCAAGTGSFLDQQASRLGLRIEDEFGALALRSRTPPRVAGRCSVFAKSDMIHLQQQAAPVHDIVAGLCVGLARNLKSNLGRGSELPQPIVFCGGVAANAGVVHALKQVFELADDQLIVPPDHACTGALGAVLVAQRERGRLGPGHGRPPGDRLDLAPLGRRLRQPKAIGHRLKPLPAPEGWPPVGDVPPRAELEARCRAAGAPIDAWLGLDVGSISTKVAVIDDEHRVLGKVYLMTAGRPLNAVRDVLQRVGAQVGGLVRIRGAATTGSGRYLTGDFIGADLVINEITAQAAAAAALDPQVDTIFEIGGQDSKYISLDGGVVVDFEMNHACAAGTGSFLEEQAERLGVAIQEEFGRRALASAAPIRLGERCTVFMESDLLSHQQQGAATDDLVAGLCYSIVSNYINRVVGRRRIGRRIFFQGGTAYNQGVVAAFGEYTGHNITVPPHHEVTGAIGAALLARRHQQRLGRDQSAFGGFALSQREAEVRSFECPHCSNQCEINEVTFPGSDRPPLYYGSRCDRYNVKKDRPDASAIPNLFALRHQLLLRHARLRAPQRDGRPTIGIPLALANYQLLPFWGTLLGTLDFNVVVSPVTTPRIAHRGAEAVLSTPCFPVKVMHGHVLELLDRGAEHLWLPSVLALTQEYAENAYNQLCPYVTSIPYQVDAAIGPDRRRRDGREAQFLRPLVRFDAGPGVVARGLRPWARRFGIQARRLRRAVDQAWEAQASFERACRDAGAAALATLAPGQRAVVVIGRPYNSCDPGLCLDLPGKLRKLGVLPLPIDFLDVREDAASGDRLLGGMYWKYGQRILRVARRVRDDPRLHAIYLTNFGCGPDSFLIQFVKRIMAPKPALVLEVDEHSADAGVVTRLEAFLESLGSNGPAAPTPRSLPVLPLQRGNGHQRTLYLPYMGDQSHAVAAAFRGCGQPSEVIPLADASSLELGRRFCSGKECLPCQITAGDMIRAAQQPGFDPSRAAFFMPGGSGPCRFGQYSFLHELILRDLGLGQVPVVSPTQDKDFYEQFRQFPRRTTRLAWSAMCAADVLQKAQLALRPYETRPGATDEVYARGLRGLCALMESGPDDRAMEAFTTGQAREFHAVPTAGRGGKPRIGVVGEIYVRQHRFANNDLVRELERFGAEVALAGFPEWMFYTNWTRLREARRERTLRPLLSNLVQDRVQRRLHARLAQPFARLLPDVHEPPTTHVLELAAPYIDASFEGEAVLSVGKMIEFHQAGCDGVVNVMPFSCMPSTIVAGVMKKLAAAFAGMPALSISYDGQQDPTLPTRLEAFLYQARAYQARGHRRRRLPAPTP